jgi:hypothetical protein
MCVGWLNPNTNQLRPNQMVERMNVMSQARFEKVRYFSCYPHFMG